MQNTARTARDGTPSAAHAAAASVTEDPAGGVTGEGGASIPLHTLHENRAPAPPSAPIHDFEVSHLTPHDCSDHAQVAANLYIQRPTQRHEFVRDTGFQNSWRDALLIAAASSGFSPIGVTSSGVAASAGSATSNCLLSSFSSRANNAAAAAAAAAADAAAT